MAAVVGADHEPPPLIPDVESDDDSDGVVGKNGKAVPKYHKSGKLNANHSRIRASTNRQAKHALNVSSSVASSKSLCSSIITRPRYASF